MLIEFTTDYNPYHDPKNGQFTTGPKGLSSSFELEGFNKARANSHKKVAGELRSQAGEADKAGKPKLAKKLRERAEKHEEFEQKYKSGELTKRSPAAKQAAKEQPEAPKPAPEKKAPAKKAEKPKPAPKVQPDPAGEATKQSSKDRYGVELDALDPAKVKDLDEDAKLDLLMSRSKQVLLAAIPDTEVYQKKETRVVIKDKKTGAWLARLERDLEADGKIANHELFTLDDSLQGKGIGKKVLAQQVDDYKAMGVQQIQTLAALNAGGYTWAKFGFLPSKSEVPAFVEKARMRVNGLPGNTPLQRQNRDRLERFVKSLDPNDPKTVWEIADSAIGKKVLAGSMWKAQLDLSNKDQMERFEAYVTKPRSKP
jgi:GNAT superfamily N-acetyltransferase